MKNEYEWHDLRKNPNDLPEDMVDCLLELVGDSGHHPALGVYDESDAVFREVINVAHSCPKIEGYTVIAWKYAECFDDTEESDA